MTRPQPSGKQSVNLASPPMRVSRIRRDPPPRVKEVTVEEVKDHDRRNAVIGVLAFALAIFIITLGFSDYFG